jgi:hypothetical protein
MDGTKEKIEKIQGLLEEASTLLAELQPKEGVPGIPSWMKDRIELWCRIYNENKGSPISKDRVDELWEKMGKDRLGTAGFFTGKRASLQWTHDGKVSLSYYADKQVKEWTDNSLQEYAKKFRDK